MFHLPVIQANPSPHHRHFTVSKASPVYSISVDIDTTAAKTDDPIQGSAVITLVSRSTGRAVQRISMPSLTLFSGSYATSVGPHDQPPSPYGNEYSFVFEDFDFDGHADLAICKDTTGSYGGPTYDVFRWNVSRAKFVRDPLLSRLSSEHLGLCIADPKTHEVLTFDKDGAAWHKSSTYKWRKRRLTLVKDEVDDATGAREVITTRTRVGSHWRVSVRHQAIKQ
jgi:hypothetical protein